MPPNRRGPSMYLLALLAGSAFMTMAVAEDVCDPHVRRALFDRLTSSDAYVDCGLPDLLSIFSQSTRDVVQSGRLLENALQRSLDPGNDAGAASGSPTQFSSALESLQTAAALFQQEAIREPGDSAGAMEMHDRFDQLLDTLLTIKMQLDQLDDGILNDLERRLACRNHYFRKQTRLVGARISSCLSPAPGEADTE